MKLSRVDLVPILAIVFGGAVSVLSSSALILRSAPSHERRPEPVVVTPVALSQPLSSTEVQRTSAMVSEGFYALLVEQMALREQLGQLSESSAERIAHLQPLRERKDQMHAVLLDLEQDLGELADREGQADHPRVAIALREAQKLIGESKLGEKILYSRGTIEQWDLQSAATLELSIEDDIRSILYRLDITP